MCEGEDGSEADAVICDPVISLLSSHLDSFMALKGSMGGGGGAGIAFGGRRNPVSRGAGVLGPSRRDGGGILEAATVDLRREASPKTPEGSVGWGSSTSGMSGASPRQTSSSPEKAHLVPVGTWPPPALASVMKGSKVGSEGGTTRSAAPQSGGSNDVGEAAAMVSLTSTVAVAAASGKEVPSAAPLAASGTVAVAASATRTTSSLSAASAPFHPAGTVSGTRSGTGNANQSNPISTVEDEDEPISQDPPSKAAPWKKVRVGNRGWTARKGMRFA